MALLPSITFDIIDHFPVEKITQELQSKRSEKNKLLSAKETKSVSDSSELVGSTKQDDSANNISNSNNKDSQDGPGIVINDGLDDSIVSVQKVSQSNTPKSKTQLWQQLKIESITRIFTLVYSAALLTFLTRLQLNILGRKNYVLSVVELADQRRNKSGSGIMMVDMTERDMAEKKEQEDEEEARLNKMYLSVSWWFINKGWISLSQQINDAVERVFGLVNPRSDLTLEKVSELVGQVQYLIDYPYGLEKSQNFLYNLLPPQELETYVLSQALGIQLEEQDEEDRDLSNHLLGQLRTLLDETTDYIESPNASEVIKHLVHTGLSVMISKVARQLYSIDTGSLVGGASSKSVYGNDDGNNNVGSKYEGNSNANDDQAEQKDPKITKTVKLASILANISKQAHLIAGGAETPMNPNEYIEAMVNVEELNAFSAIVYSNFDWSHSFDNSW